MALGNNTELKAAIADWINRSDLTTQIIDFITLAESRMVDDLKETTILTKVTDITTDANFKDLPANYKGTISAYLDTDPKQTLDYKTPDQFDLIYASSTAGKPKCYTLRDNDIYFAPLPDSSYTCKLTHYARPDIATDTTNELLTNSPNLYLWGALVEAASFLNDDKREAKFERKYQTALQGVKDTAIQLGALSVHIEDSP